MPGYRFNPEMRTELPDGETFAYSASTRRNTRFQSTTGMPDVRTTSTKSVLLPGPISNGDGKVIEAGLLPLPTGTDPMPEATAFSGASRFL